MASNRKENQEFIDAILAAADEAGLVVANPPNSATKTTMLQVGDKVFPVCGANNRVTTVNTRAALNHFFGPRENWPSAANNYYLHLQGVHLKKNAAKNEVTEQHPRQRHPRDHNVPLAAAAHTLPVEHVTQPALNKPTNSNGNFAHFTQKEAAILARLAAREMLATRTIQPAVQVRPETAESLTDFTQALEQNIANWQIGATGYANGQLYAGEDAAKPAVTVKKRRTFVMPTPQQG